MNGKKNEIIISQLETEKWKNDRKRVKNGNEKRAGAKENQLNRMLE